MEAIWYVAPSVEEELGCHYSRICNHTAFVFLQLQLQLIHGFEMHYCVFRKQTNESCYAVSTFHYCEQSSVLGLSNADSSTDASVLVYSNHFALCSLCEGFKEEV